MLNLIVGLSAAHAGTACGFVFEAQDGSGLAIIDDPAVPGGQEDFYECDNRAILNETWRGDKICINYSTRTLKEQSRDGSTYVLTGCAYASALCEENRYLTSSGCNPCASDRTAMNYFDQGMTLPDKLTNKYYHSNTSCPYCETGKYLSGNSCIQCPSDSNGRPVGSYANTGITGCFASLGYSNQTTGKDNTGSYVITTQEDFYEMVIDPETGYMEREYFCSYKS